MSLFRTDRTLSHFLRHDPFAPFARPSLSPFYSPFFTVFDEPRTQLYDYPQHQHSLPSSTSPHSSKASPSSPAKAASAPHEVARSGQDESQVERRSSRRPARGRREDHPLSLWGGSPFTGSAFPSLFNAALSPFGGAVQAVPDIRLDVHSTPQAYSVEAAVPGMDKNDIKVTVDDGVLTIEAERRETRGRQPTTNSTNTNNTNGSSASTTSTTTGTQSADDAKTNHEVKADESKEEKTAPDAQTNSAVPSSNTSSSTTTTSANSAMEEDPDDFHYSETYYGRVQRSIQLPEDAKVEELTAKYENGLLKIDIPRVQEQKPKGRRVEIQ